ncbi:MAG: histone deacetylase family protein [Methanothrix sp.]|nr:histone deacetylase family protein [Methanothrix sp.]MCX8206549.1 histone deacetylase family protein [Methanothrix sp.]
MIIVYSRGFEGRYPTNPVEHPDRVRLAAQELSGYEFFEPAPASHAEISAVHTEGHIERVRLRGLYEAAALAAGGAVAAARISMMEPAFGLIRPPGHHASADHSWGMCFFNNIAIAVKAIRKHVRRLLILDIDLHFGDGTVSIFRWDPDVSVVNIGAIDANFDYIKLESGGYIEQVEKALESHEYDIICVSAGFDTYRLDWGGILDIDDYMKIGSLIRDASEDRCGGRRFAVLEGGYHQDLRYCIRSFISGFE